MYELYVPYIICPECDMLGRARATSDAEATGSKPVQDIASFIFIFNLGGYNTDHPSDDRDDRADPRRFSGRRVVFPKRPICRTTV